MVDNDIKAGHQAVERAAAALETSTLGPGTVGYTISGAAYRGKEVAANTGQPGPAEVGFGDSTGLGYVDQGGSTSGYSPAQRTET